MDDPAAPLRFRIEHRDGTRPVATLATTDLPSVARTLALAGRFRL